MTIIVIRGNPDDSAGTMNKKCPQIYDRKIKKSPTLDLEPVVKTAR